MILLTGWLDCAGNLHIESSAKLPDDTSKEDFKALVDEAVGNNKNGWAASFLVEKHRAACQEAYETYVRDDELGEDGPRLIDEVRGILVDM
ncbi:hypothetical protein [Streptomyces sp. YIM 121038]|uniref:hypothetical protein n=1 Tax=Streptomyces sp. YIM 121038 TaxID=2136401 RepID=UPI00111078B1|nr:hypothetical protein [Streptomyces sp. YIM 121038]